MNNLIKLIVKNLILILLAAGIAYISSKLPLRTYRFLSGGCAIPIDDIGLPEDYQWPLCSIIIARYRLQIQIFSGLILFLIYYLTLRILLGRLFKW